MANLQDWQRKHWARRWGRSKLDGFMGGRGLTPINRKAGKIIVHELKAKSLLDVGGGTFKVLKYCHELDPTMRLAGTEIDYPNVKNYLRPFIEVHLSMIPFPFPWPDDTFDVAYQNNTLANLQSRHVEPTVREMARVARTIVFGAGWGSRFWEWGKTTGVKKHAWMMNVMGKYCEYVSRETDFGITIWKCRRPLPLLEDPVPENIYNKPQKPCITKINPNLMP